MTIDELTLKLALTGFIVGSLIIGSQIVDQWINQTMLQKMNYIFSSQYNDNIILSQRTDEKGLIDSKNIIQMYKVIPTIKFSDTVNNVELQPIPISKDLIQLYKKNGLINSEHDINTELK